MSATLETPRYKLNAPYWDNATLWPEGTVIQFTGVPNGEMVPLNESAEHRMRDWLAELARGADLKAAGGAMFAARNTEIVTQIPIATSIPREMPRDNGPVPVRPDMMNAGQKRAYTKRVSSQVVGAELPKPPPRGAGAQPVAILGSTFTDDAAGVSR